MSVLKALAPSLLAVYALTAAPSEASPSPRTPDLLIMADIGSFFSNATNEHQANRDIIALGDIYEGVLTGMSEAAAAYSPDIKNYFMDTYYHPYFDRLVTLTPRKYQEALEENSIPGEIPLCTRVALAEFYADQAQGLMDLITAADIFDSSAVREGIFTGWDHINSLDEINKYDMRLHNTRCFWEARLPANSVVSGGPAVA